MRSTLPGDLANYSSRYLAANGWACVARNPEQPAPAGSRALASNDNAPAANLINSRASTVKACSSVAAVRRDASDHFHRSRCDEVDHHRQRVCLGSHAQPARRESRHRVCTNPHLSIAAEEACRVGQPSSPQQRHSTRKRTRARRSRFAQPAHSTTVSSPSTTSTSTTSDTRSRTRRDGRRSCSRESRSRRSLPPSATRSRKSGLPARALRSSRSSAHSVQQLLAVLSAAGGNFDDVCERTCLHYSGRVRSIFLPGFDEAPLPRQDRDPVVAPVAGLRNGRQPEPVDAGAFASRSSLTSCRRAQKTSSEATRSTVGRPKDRPKESSQACRLSTERRKRGENDPSAR